MGENDLIVSVHGVLHVLAVLHVHRGTLLFEIGITRGVEVHGAEGRGGDVDVVDVVEHHRLVGAGQGDVLLGLLRTQSISSVADDLFDQASSGDLEEQGHGHKAQEEAFDAHDDTLTLRQQSIQVSSRSSCP